MKKIFLCLIVAYGFFCCGSPSDKASSTDATSSDGSTSSEALYTICIWDKASVKETPEEKGKWLTSINLGEKVTSLDESQVDDASAKKREYIKIKLMDGKEGWVQKDFFVINAKAAALTSETDLYSRPDLLAKSNKTFKRMDVVAVSEEKDDWLKITGKRKEGTWIDEGYIKVKNVSYSDQDVAFAVFYKKALAITDPKKQIEELTKLVNNSDLSASQFVGDVQDMLNPDDGVIEEEPEAPMDSTAASN